MKIGFFCESSADQAAVAVFTEALLGVAPERIADDVVPISLPRLFEDIEAVVKKLHYQSDADGLVIVVDSDRSVLHELDHDFRKEHGSCHYCRVADRVARAQSHLAQRKSGPTLKVAIGVAVPTMEGWCLFRKNHEVGEAAWRAGLPTNQLPFTPKQLKKGDVRFRSLFH